MCGGCAWGLPWFWGGLCVSGIWGPFSQRHTDIQVRVASPFVFRKAEEGDESAVGGWMDGWLAGTLCPLIFPKILPPHIHYLPHFSHPTPASVVPLYCLLQAGRLLLAFCPAVLSA